MVLKVYACWGVRCGLGKGRGHLVGAPGGPSRPVSRVLWSCLAGPVTIYLALQLPIGSSNQPEDIGRATLGPPIRSCSGWGLHSPLVTQWLVSSYLTISPLSA